MVEESLRDDDDVEVNSDDENDPELLVSSCYYLCWSGISYVICYSFQGELQNLASDDDEKAEEDMVTGPEPNEQEEVGSGSIIKVLEERLKMYQEAESKSKAAGETARVRR